MQVTCKEPAPLWRADGRHAPRRRDARVDPAALVAAWGGRYAGAVIALSALYSTCVAAWTDAGLVTFAPLATALLLGLVLQAAPAAARRALSAGGLVCATLHLRVLDPTAATAAVEVWLATAVLASTAATLGVDRAPRHVAVGVGALAAAAVGFVSLPTGAGFVAAALGAGFAALRPLGALAAVARAAGWHRGPTDEALWWRPTRERMEVAR